VPASFGPNYQRHHREHNTQKKMTPRAITPTIQNTRTTPGLWDAQLSAMAPRRSTTIQNKAARGILPIQLTMVMDSDRNFFSGREA
jgi:hypothetical protein